MSTVAFIRRCLSVGMDLDMALKAAEAFEAEAPRPHLVDEQAERRRAKDRERKRLRNSAESAETAEKSGIPEALPLPPSPQNPEPPAPTRVRDISTRMREAFDRWWADYPRKVGKEDAWRKYQIASRKIGDDFEAVLVGGLERAKASWTDAQFIPHPATWLHQGRWEDEPTVTPLRPRQANVQRPDDRRETRNGIWAEIADEERRSGAGLPARTG